MASVRASRVVLALAAAAGLSLGAAACSALLGIQGATARPAVVKLAAGGSFACALLADGTVWCWGADDHQQLGHVDLDADVPCRWALPDGGSAAGLCNPTPTQVADLHAKDIALGTDFACALLETGQVECWGSNDTGQLGPLGASDFTYSYCPRAFFDGGTATEAVQCTPVPTPVQGLPSPATAIAAGSLHACAATTGGVYCWGNSGMNILDSPQGGTGPYKAADVHSALALAAPVTEPTSPYTDNTCALISPESTICWGPNDLTDDGCPNQPCTLTTTGVKSVHVGYLFGCTLGGGGTLDCWGENYYDAFGSTVMQNMTPMPSDYVSLLGTTGKTVATFEARSTHALAIDTAGELLGWGSNLYGQLGAAPAPSPSRTCNSGYCVSIPTLVSLDDGGAVSAVATGVDFSLALTADGTVWAWGANNEGQLGRMSDGGLCPGVDGGAKPCDPTPAPIQVPP
jgi:alpha-tubulin suppressor-like RCC1 family protein